LRELDDRRILLLQELQKHVLLHNQLMKQPIDLRILPSSDEIGLYLYPRDEKELNEMLNRIHLVLLRVRNSLEWDEESAGLRNYFRSSDEMRDHLHNRRRNHRLIASCCIHRRHLLLNVAISI
jgi:hypothetical protein